MYTCSQYTISSISTPYQCQYGQIKVQSRHFIFLDSKWKNEEFIISLFLVHRQIFTEDIPEVESLPRHAVLDHLMSKAKELAIPYLEHIIHNCNDETPEFHNRLIHLYREKVQELLAEYIPSLPEGKGVVWWKKWYE